MDRKLAASYRGRRTGTALPFATESFIDLHEKQLDAAVTNERRGVFVVLSLIFSILFLGAAAIANIGTSSAMDRCEAVASFDTCFSTLNR
nr:hypothetical protein [Brucella anthropi]